MVKIVPFPPVEFIRFNLKYYEPSGESNATVKGRNSSNTQAPGYFKGNCEVVINTHALFLEWQAFQSIVEGTTNVFPLRIPTHNRSPLSVSNDFSKQEEEGLYADGTMFEDNTGYGGSEVPAFFSQAKSSLDNSGTIQIDPSGSLHIGQFFTAFSLHNLTTVRDVGSGAYKVTFNPPLTRDHPAGRELEFGQPVGFFQLDGKMQGTLENEFYLHARPEFAIKEASPSTVAQIYGIEL